MPKYHQIMKNHGAFIFLIRYVVVAETIFEKKLEKFIFFRPSKNLEGLTVHAWTALFVDDLNLRITVSAIIAFWKKPRSRLFHKEVMKFVLHRQMTI